MSGQIDLIKNNNKKPPNRLEGLKPSEEFKMLLWLLAYIKSLTKYLLSTNSVH